MGVFSRIFRGKSEDLNHIQEFGQSGKAWSRARQNKIVLHPEPEATQLMSTVEGAVDYMKEIQEDYYIPMKDRKMLDRALNPVMKTMGFVLPGKDDENFRNEMRDRVYVYDVLAKHATILSDKSQEKGLSNNALMELDNFWMAAANESNQIEEEMEGNLPEKRMNSIMDLVTKDDAPVAVAKDDNQRREESLRRAREAAALSVETEATQKKVKPVAKDYQR